MSIPPSERRGRSSARPQQLAALLEVLGDQRCQLVVALGVELDQCPRRGGMGRGALLAELGPVGDLPGQRVTEGQHPLRVDLGLVEEPGRDQLLQPICQCVVFEAGDHAQRRLGDLVADHCGGL